jgi:hypothetical protein
MNRIAELEKEAQHAAERRLSVANAMFVADEEGGHDDADHPEWDEISGAYCGCDTCIVREVLDAAWPHLKEIAFLMIMDDKKSPSDYEEVQRLKRAIKEHFDNPMPKRQYDKVLYEAAGLYDK